MDSDGYRFRMQVDVDPNVVDELGHVSNVVYLTWALEAARQHSAAVGYDPAKYAELGEAFVVRRHEIDYKRPVFGGQTVEVTTWVESWTSAASIRRTEIRVAEEDAPVAASVATQWVWAALPSGRPKRIPQQLKEAYNAYRG